MKSKHLLLLLFIAMFAPWAANAQNRDIITIGTGTSTNYYPMPGFWGFQYDVYLYTPGASEELNANNCTISSIAYDLSSINTTSGAKMEIWLKDVDADYVLDDATTFSQYIDGATKVVDDDEFTTAETGWKTMSFTEDFVHEAGMGLLVAVRGVGCSGTGGCSRYCRYTTASYMHWGKHADSSDPGQNVSGTLDGNRSNIQLAITETAGVTCPKPTNLTVSNLTSNSATVNWVSDGTWFHYQYRESGEEEWIEHGGDGGTGNTFASLTEVLEPNTTYEFRVQNICNPDPLEESAYATTQFTTPCGAITTFPWTEDFESYASGNFANPCWVNEHISGSGTNVFKVYTSTNGTNSTHQLQLPDQSGGTLTKLVLPEMTLPGDNYEFVIDVYRSNSTYNSNNIYEGVRVYASTDGEIEGATELAFIPRQYNTGNDVIPEEEAIGWYTYELPIGISGTCYIILRGESQYCTSTYMDNFKVKQIPTCLPPTGLQVVEGSITSTGASFTWDAEEGATFQYYTIENPWEGFAPTEETSWTSTTNNSAGWANAFSPNTTQRFYLRKDCGNDDYSDYIYVEFRTLCGPISLISNYSEDFDGYTSVSSGTDAPTGYPNVDLPYCWQFLNLSESTSTYPQAFLTSSSTYAVSGNCLFFKSSNATPLYAILPEFVQDISEYQLTFTYRNEGTGNYNGKLYVGYIKLTVMKERAITMVSFMSVT